MAPKGGNAKKESGRAKKAENEKKKKDTVANEAERKEAASWEQGAKGKSSKDDKAEKRQAELARKAENARLLAEEEAGQSSKAKAAPKAGGKKKAAEKPAGPGAIASGGGLASATPTSKDSKPSTPPAEEQVESFAATGIDNALDLLDAVTAKMDKASIGSQAAKSVDSHPERRFKAALETYTERELANVRRDHPGLRLNQYKELLYKQFQKSPENPFNQANVSYDASKEEKVAALNAKRMEVEERLREKGKHHS